MFRKSIKENKHCGSQENHFIKIYQIKYFLPHIFIYLLSSDILKLILVNHAIYNAITTTDTYKEVQKNTIKSSIKKLDTLHDETKAINTKTQRVLNLLGASDTAPVPLEIISPNVVLSINDEKNIEEKIPRSNPLNIFRRGNNRWNFYHSMCPGGVLILGGGIWTLLTVISSENDKKDANLYAGIIMLTAGTLWCGWSAYPWLKKGIQEYLLTNQIRNQLRGYFRFFGPEVKEQLLVEPLLNPNQDVKDHKSFSKK